MHLKGKLAIGSFLNLQWILGKYLIIKELMMAKWKLKIHINNSCSIFTLLIVKINKTMRYTNLYCKLVDKALLNVAFDNAAKGKNYQPSVAEAILHKEELVDKLYYMLETETYKPSAYQVIHKYEPKYREIFVAPFFPERILHHAVMLILIPILEKQFYEHSYSCIKGKGQHKAVIQNHIFVKNYKYCLKCDISKFYPSINRKILLNIFRKFIKDIKFINLLDKIIFSAPGSEWEALIHYNIKMIGLKLANETTDSKRHELFKDLINVKYVSNLSTFDNIEFERLRYETNVPIGNYCSQWFGNLYLTELDNLITNRLNKYDKEYGPYFSDSFKYIRYCDDFILYSNNKKELQKALFIIKRYLFTERCLLLSKERLFCTKEGVDFCGYKVYPNGTIIVRPSTKKRIKRKIKELIYKIHKGYVTINHAMSVVGSYKGLIQFSNSIQLYRSIKLNNLKTTLDYYKGKYNSYIDKKVRLEF